MRSRFSLAAFAVLGGCLLPDPLGAFSVQAPCLSLSVPVWTNNQIQFTFLGRYGATYVIETSTDLQNWTRIATNSDSAIRRVITLDAQTGSSFYRTTGLQGVAAGFAVKQGVNFKGNDITVDAYDSADTNSFPNGLWNSTNGFAGGNMAALGGGVLDVGNAKIHGRLLLAPGANYSLAANGLVGDVPLNWPPQTGIEGPEWVCTRFVFDLPDLPSPYTSGLAPAAGTGTNTYVLATANYYVDGNLSVGQNLQVDGIATLYVTGNFAANSVSFSPSGSLRLFVGQASGSASSATIGNAYNVGDASNLQFFGLPTCNSLTLASSAGYLGTVYGPEANLTINAGGASAFEYQGACRVNSITANGHVNFHFDQNLSR